MSVKQKYTIEIDNLAVGLTRPPMVFGVMLEVAFFNLMLCTLGYLHLHSIWVIPLFGVLHLIAVRLSIHEPHFLNLFLLWLTKTPPILNAAFWGYCNSYSPE